MFTFLGGNESPYWDAVRDALEHWFGELPATEQDELKRRFRTGKYGEILSAFWQLYVHALLVRTFTVKPHPAVSGSNRRPDFLAVNDAGESFFLEAAVIVEADEQAARRRVHAAIFDHINSVPSPRFWLRVYFDAEGSRPPPAARLRPFLIRWLATLDYHRAVELATAKRFGELPVCRWQRAGWTLRFMALPKVPPERGPTIGMYPTEGGVFDSRSEILPTLKKKASRYGQLDRPYVIAVLCDSVVADDSDIEAALYGRTTVSVARVEGETSFTDAHRKADGLWTPARGTRVSAVMTALRLKPWAVARVVPRLWINPWATAPLTVAMPWTSLATATDTDVSDIGQPTIAPCDVLGLGSDWPPGEPFPDQSRNRESLSP